MSKSDTLTRPNSKVSLQDVLTRASMMEPKTTPRRRAEDKLTDTQNAVTGTSAPAHVVGSESGVVLEPVRRKPYDLSYACLLIPRFSAHFLIGDIAENLREWMHQVCISYAWRLEEISVRPEFMQWVVFVPPATAPSRVIHTVRDQTSKFIFEDFPHIRRENVSKDFWAPGYLVLVGPTMHPPEMINEFIRLTRQHQGIQPRLSE